MSMRTAVLGANGFIGRHLVRRLADAGFEVLAAVRSPPVDMPPAAQCIVSPFERAQDFAPLLSDCGLVIHAASTTTPSSSAFQPQIEGNLRTTLALIEALQEHPSTRLIYLSSGGTLYGDCVNHPDESAPLRPRSYHGAGKAAAEHFIHAWTAQFEGSGATIIRPSNVYGPGQFAKRGFAVIPTAFEHVLGGTAMPIWGDGSAVRDYLFVDDLVELIMRILARGIADGLEVLNASASHGVSLNALLDLVGKVSGRPLARDHQPQRRIDIQRIVPDAGAARDRLGWVPLVGIEEGLQRTWQWFTSRAR